MQVIKRNGKSVNFDQSKIINAIKKAAEQVGVDVAKKTTTAIVEKVEDGMNVEEIQDIVVKGLMKSYPTVALAYQSYRAVRADFRRKERSLEKQVQGIFEANDKDILDENANKDAKTISVQRDLLAGITSKDFYLNRVLPEYIAKAHEKGEIHIHDLDYLIAKETNCEVVHLERMLRGGCKIGNADMAEPNSIEVAVGHTVQIIAGVSSNTYGGCSIPYLDRDLIPYIRKSFFKHYNTGLKYLEKEDPKHIENDVYFEDSKIFDKVYKELKCNSPKAYEYATDMTINSVKQAMQGLEYEINSLSTVNGQTPFTTIGIGTETSWEGRLVQEYVFKTRMEGFGVKKETAIFPKIVYAVCEGVNFLPTDPNWDISQIAFKCMTKSIYPDILFVEKETVEKEEVIYPMGCRAFLSPWYDEDGKMIVKGRGNLGATSINLPRIAIKNIGDEEGFYKELDRILDICKDNSLFRINYLEGIKSDIAPILWQSGAIAELKKGETIKDIFTNGYMTISIGYIGLSEVSKLLYGTDFAYDKDIYNKCVEIMKHIRSKVDQFKEETGIGFALYSTPSESLCKRFEEMDLKEFGIIEGITDKGYYDNSFHVSSAINMNPFRKLELEAPFHNIASGGHISYIESDSLKGNIEAVIKILRYGKSVGIHYMGINQPIDKCHECGFEGEFSVNEKGFHCPQCGNHNPETISVIRRVCGYLSQPNDRPFNAGKQKEVINRVKHW